MALFLLQGLHGLFWFELIWKGTVRVREGQEECFKEFPMYRRLDVQNWNRLKL